jgi:micrococcal nuclease
MLGLARHAPRFGVRRSIDAPEKTQAFGERSKQSPSDLCFGRDATYKAQTIDKYGRTVARVTCGGADVNRAQVERGMAWVYDKYNTDHSLPAVQANAMAGSKGLWAEKSPIPPWEFRHPPQTSTVEHSGAQRVTSARAAGVTRS